MFKGRKTKIMQDINTIFYETCTPFSLRLRYEELELKEGELKTVVTLLLGTYFDTEAYNGLPFLLDA